MKISAFHLMPHRELPADFEKRYESVWVTPPWWELADAGRVGQYYNWTLDELIYAPRLALTASVPTSTIKMPTALCRVPT
jgi:hypothetical protein